MSKKTTPLKKKKSYTFKLDNINTSDLHKQYKIPTIPSFGDIKEIPDNYRTPIDNLKNQESDTNDKIISFLDDSKNNHRCLISFINFKNTNQYKCFWCRNLTRPNTLPVGIPIRYIPREISKKYYSEIKRKEYSIKENIDHRKLLMEKNIITLKEGDYFETDGYTCSFNCAAAYINDNYFRPEYQQSKYLLIQMYNRIFKTCNKIIQPAPSWRIQKCYGGFLNTEEYYNSFNSRDFIEHGKFYDLPLYKPIGTLYEEKIKF